MKILFLLAYYYPETAASIYLFDNIIDALISDGNDVDLVCPIPGRGVESSINREYRHRLIEHKKNGHLRIRRYRMPMEGKGSIGRFWRYIKCCSKTFFISLRIKSIDVIFAESTPPILGMTAAFLKPFKQAPLVYNLQDIFPDSLVLTGLGSKNSIFWKIGRIIENYTYRHSDKIITISQGFKENIMRKKVPEEIIDVVYNWVDQKAVIDIPREKNKLISKYDLDTGKFIVTYCGNIGLSQNMNLLIDVAKDLAAITDIQFILIGNGAFLPKVKQILEASDIKNVLCLPFQPYEDISHVFSLGDVSLVISKPGTGEGCVPSKTWSIMSAARPVLANFDPNEIKTIIEVNKCGLFTDAGDKVALEKAIIRLYKDREFCRECGQNGRRFILENLTREVGSAKYAAIIRTIRND